MGEEVDGGGRDVELEEEGRWWREEDLKRM